MAKDDAEEAVYDPSPKKLRRLRQDGQVPRSQDLTNGLTLVALLGYLMAAHGQIFARMQAVMAEIPISHPRDFTERLIIAADLCVGLTAQIVLPIFGIVLATAIIGTMLDVGGFLFSTQSLMPNFSRFNPASGIGQIFSLRSLIELIKGLVKLIILGVATWIIVTNGMNQVFWSPTCGIPCILEIGGYMTAQIIGVGMLLLIVAAAVDVAIQRWLFNRDQKMTLTEVKKEQKDDSGDPHVRAARRRIRNEMAQTAGLVGMNQANLLLVGEGMVVAITYKPDLVGVPIIAAKARGDAASRDMIARGRERGIAIHGDANLTPKLIGTPVGDSIPRDLFSTVAQILIKYGLVKRN